MTNDLSRFHGIYIVVIYLLVIACHGESRENHVDENQIKEHFTNANKIFIQDEAKAIQDFIQRHQFKMTMTGTGLRYEVFQTGTGKIPQPHNIVSVAYKLFLLDGTLCDSMSENKPLSFRIGEGAQVRGMEEGLMQMKEGDKARLIVPSHLGYGMTGDEHKIPGGSTLYYDIYLIKVSE